MLTAKDIVSMLLFERSLGGAPLRDVETVGGKHHLPGGRDHQAFKEQCERDRINTETAKQAIEASQAESDITTVPPVAVPKTKKPKNVKKTKKA